MSNTAIDLDDFIPEYDERESTSSIVKVSPSLSTFDHPDRLPAQTARLSVTGGHSPHLNDRLSREATSAASGMGRQAPHSANQAWQSSGSLRVPLFKDQMREARSKPSADEEIVAIPLADALLVPNSQIIEEDRAEERQQLDLDRQRLEVERQQLELERNKASSGGFSISKQQWIGIIVGAIVISVVATVAGLCGTGNCSGSSPSPAEGMSRISVIQTLVLDGNGAMPEPESPQGKALDWLIMDQSDRTIPLVSDDRLMTRYALAVFYFSTNGAKWNIKANFLSSDHHECDWNIGDLGVACDSNLRVTELSLVNNMLRGSIPDEIKHLPTLNILNLRGDVKTLPGDGKGSVNVISNVLSGTLTTQIGTLSRLILLDVSQNGFLNGTIPTELAQIDELVELRLNDNEFMGLVPDVIGGMAKLTYVNLANNSLTGAAPTSLESIRCVFLAGNKLDSCFFRRRLQAYYDRTPTKCTSVSPPCGLQN